MGAGLVVNPANRAYLSLTDKATVCYMDDLDSNHHTYNIGLVDGTPLT